MNQFRRALDDYLAGRHDLSAVERELHVSLARQPQLAAAHGAYIEALYRSGRIAGEIYVGMAQTIRSFQQTQSRAGAPAAAPTPAPSEPVAPAPPDAQTDKTQFRAPKVAASTPAPAPATGTPSSTDSGAEKTQFRAPRVATPAPAPAAPQVPPGGRPDPSWSPATGSSTGSHTGASLTGGTTGGGRSTGSSTWGTTGSWTDANSAPLVTGDVVKGRFVLEEELGRGGMGIVFKARDLRKEEAQDRNPFVAVKLLNEEFKRHPESLKALQRESRKAQSLAHPNVVTVYDFDRDGSNVYMVMELLEGESLDRLIKRMRGTGVETAEALRIVRDICRAMAYAHERGIVHSDFKPANTFLTREGVVKVFDFGIARAAKRADNSSGSVTLFDPSTLGALTPAYASCEMIEGLEPDARDDVYAIACVAYELLTGSHPFDRKSAVQARDAGLVAKAPQSLSRVQWRALQRGLAFQREARSASALELLNGLLPPKRSPAVVIGAAAAVVAVIVIAAVVVPNQITRYRDQSRAAALASGSAARIEPVLPQLRTMDSAQRNAVLANDEAKAGLIRYFGSQITAASDVRSGAGDFQRAEALVAELRGFLPDSAAVKEISDRLVSQKSDEIKRQSDRFDSDLARGLLIPAQGGENIEAVLAIVRRIDPGHPLLHDPRLPGAYAAQARLALQRSDLALAQMLVERGLSVSPGDVTLSDLRDQAAGATHSRQIATRVAELERSLGALMTARAGLAEYAAKRAEIAELNSTAPQSPVLAQVQQAVQQLIQPQVQDLVAHQRYDDAQKLLLQYADVVSPAFEENGRQQLTAARVTLQNRLAAINDAITDAVGQRRLGAGVRGGAEQHLAELMAAGADADQLNAARDQIAQGYMRMAAEARERSAWADAHRFLDAGIALKPTTSMQQLLQQAAQQTAEAERLAKVQLDAAQRREVAAQRAREETDMRAQLAAGLRQPQLSLDDARRLAGLVDTLAARGANDAPVTGAKLELQKRLAQSAASISAAQGAASAAKFAEQAVAVFPDSQVLRQTLDGLRTAVANGVAQQRDSAVADIKKQIDGLLRQGVQSDSWDVQLKGQLQKLTVYLAPSDPYFNQTAAAASAAYLNQARQLRESQRLTEAGRMLDRARAYAPSAQVAAEDKLLADARTRQASDAASRERTARLEALKQKLRDQAQANEVNEAQASLTTLRDNLPANDAFLTQEGPQAIAHSYLRLASGALRDASVARAASLIDRGREVVPGIPDLDAAQQRYARYATLDHQVSSDAQPNAAAIRRELDQLAKASSADTAIVRQRLARTLVDRIKSAADAASAERLTTTARELFPDEPGVQALAASAGRPRTPVATPTEAPATLVSTPAVLPQSPTAPPPAATQTGSPATTAPAVPVTTSISAQAPLPSGACGTQLAGYGRRKQGICFDALASGGRGPDLVVIPAPPGGAAFAIGRTEVSNADYALYCSHAGHCGPASGASSNPVTAISIADAQHYLEWLSRQTGATYRLPTDAEWTHAANAQGGSADRSSVNCVIEIDGKRIRGFALDTVLSGGPNNWGLYNYAGNAQEWVRTGASIAARGGAYTDNVSDCTAAMSRPHSGNADAVTGFRVLRELK
jgi:serine/threonine protein kinase/uncharacterized protein YciI